MTVLNYNELKREFKEIDRRIRRQSQVSDVLDSEKALIEKRIKERTKDNFTGIYCNKGQGQLFNLIVFSFLGLTYLSFFA
jgi:hypothetical protein